MAKKERKKRTYGDSNHMIGVMVNSPIFPIILKWRNIRTHNSIILWSESLCSRKLTLEEGYVAQGLKNSETSNVNIVKYFCTLIFYKNSVYATRNSYKERYLYVAQTLQSTCHVILPLTWHLAHRHSESVSAFKKSQTCVSESCQSRIGFK